MIIASCLLDLHLPESHSLKEKRSVIKSLKDTLRNQFNISIAEMDHQDLWQRAILGVALIAPNTRFANQVLSKVVKAVEGDLRVELLDYKIEIQ
ncbi:DUF503 domain-containing protein [candidate division TA06 bacterium]|nr:DUF503 domain-containing protein [candidate division TA06 bacterium]